MKRYRDENGKLIITLNEIKSLTRDEADNYYVDGGKYTFEGKAYTMRRFMDKDTNGDALEVIRLVNEDGFGPFFCPDGLGTWLPDVASDGNEMVRIDWAIRRNLSQERES